MYINNFFAQRRNFDQEICKEIITVGLNLDKTIEGKQLLNLMQMTYMHEINLADLAETGLLIKKYKKIYSQK